MTMGWAIALHGGAGNFQRSMPPEHQESCKAALRYSLKIGVDALKSGQSPLDVVEIVVRELEDHPYFNAGKGSDLSSNGNVEMEACIMDGKTMKCGAVSGLTTVKNPISLARLVMEETSNVYLAFDGAEAFAREQGVETADPSYFITPENIEKLKQAKVASRDKNDDTKSVQKVEEHGTVGCVAVDGNGNLAAATSTGGFANKTVGRIGGTPIVGAGTYANSMCAVSATGDGEAVIRATIARDVSALMEYKGISLKDASTYAIEEILPKSTAGFIAVSAAGDVSMMFNTTGMFRACASEDGYQEVGIWPNEACN